MIWNKTNNILALVGIEYLMVHAHFEHVYILDYLCHNLNLSYVLKMLIVRHNNRAWLLILYINVHLFI